MESNRDAHSRFWNAFGRSSARALTLRGRFSLLLVLVGMLGLGLPLRVAADPIPVRVGVYENAPKIYTDAQGEVAGFWPDLVNALAADEAWQIEWVHGEWEDLLTMLETNQIDMLPDVGWSEARSQIYVFNQEQVLASWSILYTHSGTQIESLVDLEGKVVAGLKGSVNLEGRAGLRDLLDDFGIRATIVEMDSYPAIFADLERGELDAGITNKDFGGLNEHNYDVVRTPIIFQPAHIQFAFPKDARLTSDLIQAIDTQLQAMKADPDSTYFQLLDQYFGTNVITEVQAILPNWVKNLMFGGAGLLVLFLLAGFVLRLMVNRRNAELRASEEKFRKAFLTSPDSININRLSDGMYVSVNFGFTQITGYASEEIVGKTSLEIEIWANPADRSALVDGLTQNGIVQNLEAPFRKKDGSLVYGLMSASVIDLDGVPHIISVTRDITERLAAENDLNVALEKYRVLFDSFPLGITITDVDGQIIEANLISEALLGLERAEQKSRQIGGAEWQVMRTDGSPMPPEEFASVRALKENRRVDNVEMGIVKGDGEITWINVTAVPVPLEEYGVAVTYGDITERMQAEQAIADREKRFRQALVAAKGGAWEWHIATNHAIWSDENYRVMGLDPMSRDSSYAAWLSAVHPDDRADAEAEVEKSVQMGQDLSIEFRVVWPDGSIHWIHDAGSLVYDEQGEPVRMFGVQLDITERKLAELEVRRRAEQLVALLEASQFLTATLTLSTALQTIAQNAATILDMETTAVYLLEDEGLYLGATTPPLSPDFPDSFRHARLDEHPHIRQAMMTYLPVIVPDSKSADLSDAERAISETRGLRTILYLPLYSGETVLGVLILGSVGATRVISKGDIDLCRTISNQAAISIQNARLLEQIQEQTAGLERRVQQRTAQLELANNELEAFSYSVSHDLRAPLRAISGFAEIIARRHRADLNDEGQHYVDNVVVASERMDQLINELLAYSRLGRSSIRPKSVALAELLSEIRVSVIDPLLSEVHGVLTVAEDLPTVWGDRGLLGQIFTNLLENAIKYHQQSRPLAIAVDFQMEGDEVVVRVQDNGIGIAPQYQEKVFTIFQRLHSEEAYPGTGIGLATVKKAVELLNGAVWVDSQPGQGSTFFVKLPKG